MSSGDSPASDPPAPAAQIGERRITHLFTTPILTYLWPDSGALNAGLRERILAQQKISPGAGYSNVGGWHSDADFENWGGEEGQELIRRIGQQVNRITGEWIRMFGGGRRIVWRLTLWANVNGKGDYNRNHTHPGCTWSGVYHVDPGDENPDRTESGMLVLYHPDAAAATGFLPDSTPNHHPIAPKAGLMVVFPSFLAHEVRPYVGERPRISVAFNAKIETNPPEELAARADR